MSASLLSGEPTPDDWSDAACQRPEHRGLDWFEIGPSGRQRRDYEARIAHLVAICKTCPLLARCARYAIETCAADGVWAGVHLEPGTCPSEARKLLRPIAGPEALPVRRCPCGQKFASIRGRYCSDVCREEARAATFARSHQRSQVAS